MTNIVIVGAGFGGLQTALNLEKKNKNIAITLVDKRDYHLFTPNLYEAATTEEQLVSISQVKKSVTLSLKNILKGRKIKLLKGELKQLDAQQRRLLVDNKRIDFDYLVLALGSQSDFFNIPGARENSLVLKDLPDALRLRNKIAFVMQSQMFETSKKNLHLIVAGGGYTGVELAGELKGLVDFLSWQNHFPREKVAIEIIEGNNKLIAGFDDRLSRDALARLQSLGVQVRLSDRISAVNEHFISLVSGEKLAYDILVWTAGVKACELPAGHGLPMDLKGRLQVNGFFQVKNYPNIFALGDLAAILGTNGRPVPSSAQDAWEQARYVAYALPFILNNQRPPCVYKNSDHGFIVNIGGKWAILSYKGFYLKGFLGYLADKFAHIRYYLSVVGLWRAVKYVIFQAEIYSRND